MEHDYGDVDICDLCTGGCWNGCIDYSQFELQKDLAQLFKSVVYCYRQSEDKDLVCDNCPSCSDNDMCLAAQSVLGELRAMGRLYR